MAVNLKEIAEALEQGAPDWEEFGESYYVNKDAGKVFAIPFELSDILDEEVEAFDDKGELTNEFRELLDDYEFDHEYASEIVRSLAGTIEYIEPLSSHEKYRIMERFIDSLDEGRAQELLSIAVDGRGAFRRFKDTAHSLGLIQSYYSFKDQAFLEEARWWCEMNEIEYEETST